jgi:ParB/RepB/Spo0J family partition protein
MVPIESVDPNPDQPRQVMGDLSELKASIAEKGIIEPLVVRQREAGIRIVAGERRYQAASQLVCGSCRSSFATSTTSRSSRCAD